MQATVELLKAAKLLLETTGWTQGMYARSNSGVGTTPNSPTACEFCMAGSVMAAAGISAVDYRVDNPNEVNVAMTALATLVDTEVYCALGVIADFNDDSYRTKQEVLDVFDRAIASF